MSEGMNATSLPDVGAILKKARESQGLSVHETADALHLRPSIVVAMENNRFDELPGTTFLKGYVKSYARLLMLSETEILDHLQQALDIESAAANAVAVPVVSGRRRSLLGLSLLLLLMGIGGVFYSWQAGYMIVSSESGVGLQISMQPETQNAMVVSAENKTSSIKTSPKIKSESSTPNEMPQTERNSVTPILSNTRTLDEYQSISQMPAPVREDEAQFAGEQAGLGATVSDSTENNTTTIETFESTVDSYAEGNDANYIADDESRSEEATLPLGGTEELSLVRVAPPAFEESVDATIKTVNGVTEVLSEVEDDRGASNDAAAPTESITGKILAEFSGDCWFQVKNGDGKVVLAALKHDGDTASYAGVLPFEVVIGAVSEVRLTFNGESVDFNRFRVRNNRTDFILE
jgi:cytoskeleton protein RodZ